MIPETLQLAHVMRTNYVNVTTTLTNVFSSIIQCAIKTQGGMDLPNTGQMLTEDYFQLVTRPG